MVPPCGCPRQCQSNGKTDPASACFWQRSRIQYSKWNQKYYYGRGSRLDYAEAAKWYRKAAEQGNSDAQYSLGHMYLFGLGVRQNSQDAANWFLKAALQGNTKARRRLESITPSLTAGE